MTEKQIKNKELIEQYPFLQPRNVWTDEIPEDFDYNYTRLDEIPDGWREAFGIELCEELRGVLEETNYLEKFRFSQIKEKYGRLCLYNFGAPEEVYSVIRKYCNLSERTCICCGKPATMMTTDWITPRCDACATGEEAMPIEKWFNEVE